MTQDAWTQAKELADSVGGGAGVFLRIDAGEKAVAAICGAPCTRLVVWNGTGTEDYDKARHVDVKPQARVAVNVWLPETGDLKIWEMAGATFRDLLTVKDKYGLNKWSFEISRQGKGKETRWKILPEENLTPEQRETIAGLTLHDLRGGGGGGAAPTADDDEAAPERKPASFTE